MKIKFGINGSTLKIIAVLTMLIDHIGAVILNNLLHFSNGIQIHDSIFWGYQICRAIGRSAFPIFCFLLVEGFLHTHNVKKYAERLLLFAFISEIPFDLAVSRTICDMESQNVFFTLFIGLLVLIGFRTLEQRVAGRILTMGYIIILLLGIVVSILLYTDYSLFGIVSIAVLYLYRNCKQQQIFIGACSFLWEPFALLGFIPIAFYNHERGIKLKYFFYFFYPVHLLILYGISIYI
ncbi:TraX family protein [Velocimicrobium porci]|uniref:Conjugal transfer protein TraX n=1 Tax=Velocimicrobium porci TaxID=2606634 RepID=A0A6L5XWG1_9FIRM|nr:TraX family protein [Velocimicrobium porci]MSS62688.1 conjugal transfer protein TraX [Velocimicrobium porci]